MDYLERVFIILYLGKTGNKLLQNLGYSMGILANTSDLLIGLKPQDVDLVTEYANSHGHSAIVKHDSMTGVRGKFDPSSLISVGPDRKTYPDGSWHWMKGTNHWDSYSWANAPSWRITINANLRTIDGYSKMLDNMSASGTLIYRRRAVSVGSAPTLSQARARSNLRLIVAGLVLGL